MQLFHARPQAIEMYTEALKLNDQDMRSLGALAKLHLTQGSWDACKQQCVLLLKSDPDNEDANIMLAEMMFHQVRATAALMVQRLLGRCQVLVLWTGFFWGFSLQAEASSLYLQLWLGLGAP